LSTWIFVGKIRKPIISGEKNYLFARDIPMTQVTMTLPFAAKLQGGGTTWNMRFKGPRDIKITMGPSQQL